MPSGRPVQRGRLGGERAGAVAELADGVLELVGDEGLEAGRQRGQELRRGVVPVLQDALVAGGARVADVGAAELPHDPVGRLDPVVHPVVELAVVLEQLQALGELPLRGDQPAVARQPRLAAGAGELVDPVGLALRGVVLPELDVGVRPVGEAVDLVERGAVGERRDHRAGGEVGGDADDVGRVDAGRLDRGGHGDAQHLAVVLGHLQRPLGRERTLRAGEARRQRALEHRVRVGVHAGAELGAVGDADDDRPARQGAVVDADDVGVVLVRGAHGVLSAGAASTGAAVLARTTSSAPMRRSGAGTWPRAARRISIARWPTAWKSWRTVVRGGMR